MTGPFLGTCTTRVYCCEGAWLGHTSVMGCGQPWLLKLSGSTVTHLAMLPMTRQKGTYFCEVHN